LKKRDFAQAEELLNLAIEESKRLPKKDLKQCESLDALALVYSWQNRLGEAEQLYRNSLSTREKEGGREQRSISSTCLRLADLRRLRGDDAQAELLLKRALAIYEKNQLPPSNVIRAMAEVARNLGKLDQSEAFFKRAIGLMEKETDQGKPGRVAICVAGLAECYRREGELKEAETTAREVLPKLEQAHSTLALTSCLQTLAELSIARNEGDEAVNLYNRAADVLSEAKMLEGLSSLPFLEGYAAFLKKRLGPVADTIEVDATIEKLKTIQKSGKP
jgi:tetratricopeptide (TPR) repeat protein